MSRCAKCNAEIKWIKMQSGKNMPVDPPLRTVVKDEGNETLVTEDCRHDFYCCRLSNRNPDSFCSYAERRTE